MAALMSGLLEGVVASLLTKYLGQYIDGLSKDNLNMSLGSGELELEDLHLRPEALDQLELPIKVYAGGLGKLSLSIPWKALKSKPAIIRLERVFLLAGPKIPKEYDEFEERRAQYTKRKRVELAEMFAAQRSGDKAEGADAAAEDKKNDTFYNRFAVRILDNIQLFVDHVHVRYEDSRACPGMPFSVGITLEHLHAQSANAQWEPSFIDLEQKVIHKLVELRNFAVYWNSNDAPLKWSNRDELRQQLERLIYTSLSAPSAPLPASLHYIVQPISGTLRLVVNRSPVPDLEVPRYTLTLALAELAFALTDRQWRDLTELQEAFKRYSRAYRYRRFRTSSLMDAAHFPPSATPSTLLPSAIPSSSPTSISSIPSSAPPTPAIIARARWNFALQSVCFDLRQRRHSWTWEAISQRRRDKMRYIELFKAALTKRLTADERPELDSLEDHLSYEEILLYRSLARALVAKDAATTAKQGGGWRLWWSGSASSLASASTPEARLGLSSETWKELYESVGYDAGSAESRPWDAPRNYVRTRVHLSLQRGVLELRDEAHRPLGRASWHGFSLALQLRDGSASLAARLHSFDLRDHFTPDTAFPMVVAPLSNVSTYTPPASNTNGADAPSSTLPVAVDNRPFWELDVHQRPLEQAGYDYAVRLRMTPLQIVWSSPLIHRVQAFFERPQVAIDDADLAQLSAGGAVAQQSTAQLLRALGDARTVHLEVDVAAPTVAMPQHLIDLHSPRLLFVLGQFRVRSAPAPPAPSASASTEANQDFLYDHYDLSLSAVQMAALLTADDVLAWTHDRASRCHCDVIEPFDVHASLQLAKVQADSLARTRLYGALPSLSLALTPTKCILVLRILDQLSSHPESPVPPPVARWRPGRAASPTDPAILLLSPEANLARKRWFEAKFTLECLSINLGDANSNQGTLTMRMKNLSLAYAKRTYDLRVELDLEALEIDDALISNAPPRPLARSGLGTGLIRIDYTGLQRESPDWANVGHLLNYRFASLDLELGPKALLALAAFFRPVAAALTKPPSATPPSSSTNASALPVTILGTPMKEERQRSRRMTQSRPTSGGELLLRLTSSAQQFRVALVTASASPLALCSVADLVLNVEVEPNAEALTLRFAMGLLTVLDARADSRRWPTVAELTGTGTAALEGVYRTLPPEESARSAHSAALEMTLHGMKLVFVQSFVTDLHAWAQAVLPVLETTASTAKRMAAEAAEQLGGAPEGRVRYHINLLNPVVRVPRHANADEVVEADLGRISLRNRFDRLPTQDVLEKKMVAVVAMNLKAGVPGTLAFNEKIVQDTNVELVLESHSMNETRTFPELLCRAEVSDIAIVMSETQFALVRAAIEENLCATVGPLPAAPPPPPPPSSSEPLPPAPVAVECWSRERYIVSVAHLSVHLSEGTGKDLVTNETRAIVSLHVAGLTGDVFMQEDDSIKGDYKLTSMRILDTRPGSANLYRALLSPRASSAGEEGGAPQEMTIRHYRAPTGDHEYVVFLDCPQIIWVPEAVSCARLFTLALVEDAVKTFQIYKTWRHSLTPSVPASAPAMRCKALISRPDICLLEDPAAEVTRALVFRSTFAINWTSVHGLNYTTYHMKDLRAHKCSIAAQDPTQLGSATPIFSPFSLSLESRLSVAEAKWKAELDPLSVFISYDDWDLAVAVLNYWLRWVSTFGVDNNSDGAGRAESAAVSTGGMRFTIVNDLAGASLPVALINASRLSVNVTNWTRGLALFLSADMNADSYNRRVEAWEPVVEAWAFELNWHRTRVAGLHASLLSTRLLRVNLTQAFIETLLTTVELWREQHQALHPTAPLALVSASAPGVLSVSPVFASAGTAQVPSPSTSSASLLSLATSPPPTAASSLSNSPSPPGTAPVSPRRGVGTQLAHHTRTLSAGGAHQLHLHPRANHTRSLSGASQLPVLLGKGGPTDQGASERAAVHAYYIRNDTGVSLWYWTETGPGRVRELKDATEEALDLQPAEGGRGGGALRPLTVQIEGYRPAHALTADRVGVRVLRLGVQELSAKDVLFDVSFRRASKLLTFRSPVMMQNLCAVSLHLLIRLGGRGVLKLVDANASLAVPLEFAALASVQIRPGTGRYQWSDALPLASLTTRAGLFACASESANEVPFVYAIQVQAHADSSQRTISLYPPLVIENLLPVALQVQLWDRGRRLGATLSAEMGEELPLHAIPLGAASLAMRIDGFEWSRPEDLVISPADSARLLDARGRPLLLRLSNSVKVAQGMRVVKVFCEYWFVNKLGLPLLFKEAALRDHPGEEAAGQRVPIASVVLQGDPREWYQTKDLEGKEQQAPPPLLFSYTAFGFRGNRTCVSVANSLWSKGVDLTAPGLIGVISVPDAPHNQQETRRYDLGVSVDAAPNQFWRTKVVTFFSRHLLANHLPVPLKYSQLGAEAVYELPPGEVVPFHWLDGSRETLLVFRPGGAWHWSGGVRIDAPLSVVMKVRPQDEEQPTLLARVQVKLDGATAVVIIGPESAEFPTYLLENRSSRALIVRQQGVLQALEETLPANAVRPFAWDEPMIIPRRLSVRVAQSDVSADVNLDKIRRYPLKGFASLSLHVEVAASGPTRVLRVWDADGPDSSNWAEVKLEAERELRAEYIFNLEGIALSIVDETPRELLLVHARKIYCEYADSQASQTIEVVLHTLQVDNQLYTGLYPVTICQVNAPGGGKDRPVLHASVVKSNQYDTIDYYEYVSVLFQEVDIKIDEECLVGCIRFWNSLADFLNKRRRIIDEAQAERHSKVSTAAANKMLYFRMLHINPVKANVSFASDPLREDRREDNVIASVIRTGGYLPNVENAPLMLNGLIFKNPFMSREDLGDALSRHYRSALVEQIYKVLGSTDVLGNPVSLLSNLGTGVYDFFHEPALGLVTSPGEFVVGLTRGTSSLVKNSVYGLFNTAAKLTGSLGHGVAALTFDPAYRRERQLMQREKPRHFGEGVAFGVRDLGIGVFRGLTGVVHEPIKGAVDGGALGAIAGLARGVQGVYVKPAVGAIDLITQTTEGIRNTTTYWDEKDRRRVRPPRFFGPEQILHAYDDFKSEGQEYLYMLEQGRYRTEWYVYHLIVDGFVFLVSNLRVVYLRVRSVREEWSIPFAQIYSLQVVDEGVSVVLKKYISENMFENPTRQRIVFCPRKRRTALFDALVEILRNQSFQQVNVNSSRGRAPAPSYLQKDAPRMDA